MTAPTTTTRALRPYQTEAVAAVHEAHERGVRRPAVVMATGTGKTTVIARLALDTVVAGKRVVVLAHQAKLLGQIAEAVGAVAGRYDLVGIVQAGRNEVGKPIVAAMVQTLSKPARLRQLDNVGLVIVDECFPADTVVGGRRIADLRVGDTVPSWDEQTGLETIAIVSRVMRKRPTLLVRVDLDNGETVTCTPNHPFLTTHGWIPAARLHGESVVSFTHDAATDNVHRVCSTDDADNQGEDRLVPTPGPGVLLGHVQGHVGVAQRVGPHGGNEPRTRVGADDCQESDARTRSPRQDGGNVAAARAQTKLTRRQRRANARASTTLSRLARLAGRGRDSAEGRSTALSLQTRHSAPVDDGVRRGGRGIAYAAGAPTVRPSAGRTVTETRVAGVSILEPGCDGTYGGVCRDGYVYNLEVAGTHTYQVGNGIVVHNCHHAAAASYQTILGGLGAFHTTPAVGFTATLSRGDDKRLGDTWDEVVFTRSIRTAIDAGNLVQPVGKSVVLDDLDLTAVKRNGGDYADGSLGEAIAAESDAIARTWASHAADRKTMVFVPSVEAAYEVADSLREHGARTEVVVGTTPLYERDRTYAAFRASELNVLVSVAVLTEGFDEPTVDCILMARPTQLAHVYIQAVGRGLRPAPGKDDCLVLDVVGVARLHSLVTLVQLDKDAPYKRVTADGGELDDTADMIEAERAEAERQGVQVLEDIDLFASSDKLWLHTRKGVRFIPAGDEAVFLWPDEADVEADDETYRVGRIGVKAALATDGWVGSDLDLADAREVAERVAGNLGAGLSSKSASWRRGNAKPSEAQVTFAKRLGVVDAANMSKARVSDEISIAFASRRLDV